MARGIKVGLISRGGGAIWAIADSGWIFQGRVTDSATGEYHGYPLLPGSPGANLIYDRFKLWVGLHPKPRHLGALQRCADLYQLKP